jgi:hypothetical protein
MQMKADSRTSQINLSSRQRTELWVNIWLNLLMYVFLLVIIAVYIGKKDCWLAIRVGKAIIEFTLAAGFLYSGIKLVKTFQQLMLTVPWNLKIWLLVGCISSLFKCGEQILLYVLEENNDFDGWVYIFLLFSYNVDDLLPTLVFLHSFKVYYKFISEDKDESSQDIDVNESSSTANFLLRL